MQELNRAAAEETHHINQTVETVSHLVELVRKVSADTANIAKSSEEVAESAQVGERYTEKIAREMQAINETTDRIIINIDEFNRTSNEISNMTAVIEGIAEQTTLLALNAAIEAARAGEYGRGFEVVASETQKLAAQSRDAAKQISRLAKQMKERNQLTMEAVHCSAERVETGNKLAGEAMTTFEAIFVSLHQNLEKIETVAHSAQQMAENNEAVIEAVTNIAAISEENAASIEAVSASAQQQSAEVEEITALADNLMQIAGGLKQATSRFALSK
jgi:methyl-accepting chemotaxis protein